MSQSLDGIISQLNSLAQPDEDEETENQNDDYEEEEEEEHDVDAEAEDIARRLKDELSAAIAKAQAEQAAAAAMSHGPAQILALPAATGTLRQTHVKKELAVLATMKSVLSYASKDPLVSFTLASASVVDANGSKSNILQILQRSVEAGFVPKELATPLSHVIVSLAKSDTLFASLKNSNAPAALLNKGKRKRDEMDHSQASREFASGPWLGFGTNENLLDKVKSAIQIIMQSLSSASLDEPLSSSLAVPVPIPLNPALISSLQAPLHQVFLFAVTTAPSSPHNGALQEIGGLIQMLGVLSGIHIGPTQPPQQVSHHNGQPDFNAAVYPCLLPSCQKTFSRLFYLRSHQRTHSAHPSIRPYRCLQCPASFARNHDLKRHLKLHGSKAFKCSGCGKVFSRRDAIKRHINSSRMKTEALVTTAAATAGHGFGRREEAERCRDGEVIEVDVDKEEGEEGVKEERRAKIWGDRMASATNFDVRQPTQDESPLEEGEIPAPFVVEAQNLVLGLFDVLSGYVAKYAPPNIATTESTGQHQQRAEFSKTVASIMASQNWMQSDPSKNATEPVVSDPLLPSLSLSWLSPEQTQQLEEAIAAAAKAAQEQAEAEAAWEEEDDGDDEPSGGDTTI